MDNLHRRSINGRHHPSVKILLLRPNSYADAEGWDDLEQAFTQSLKHSPFDEMILLLHTGTPGAHEQRSEYVRPVSYNRLDEVPKLLLSTAPSAWRTGLTRSYQHPHVEAATEIQPDGDGDGQVEQEHIGIPRERITDGKEAEVVTFFGDHEEEIDETQVNAAIVIQDVYRRHLERKRAGAARKIQAAYRLHLKRSEGIDAIQTHYWHLLRKRSAEMEWSKDPRYYLLFRVPLGYVLVCLDVIKTFVESEKKEAKKHVMAEDDKHLVELMEALDRYR